MLKLHDLVNWKLDTVLPEMAGNHKFEEILRQICDETEKTDPAFKTLKRPVYNLNLGGIIVVMGLPIVDKDKAPKLRSLFDQKLLPSAGVTADDLEDFELEWAADKQLSTGNAILKFKEEEKANKVAEKLNRVLVPPKFVLTVLTLNEYEEAMAYYKSQSEIPLINHTDLLARHDANTDFEKVSFVTTSPRRTGLDLWSYNYYDRQVNSEGSVDCSFIPKEVFFSDSGNLMAAIVGNYFEIYGGSEYKLLRKFQHKNVSFVKFSRREKFAISYNGPADVKNGSDNLIVWNVLTGDKVRSFQISSKFHFESFQFSYSEKYLCGIVKDPKTDANLVGVYELPTCQLLAEQGSKDRTYLPVEGVLEISWAPQRDALFVAGSTDKKSDLAIWEIPERKRIPLMAISYKIDAVTSRWGEHEKSLFIKLTGFVKKKIETTVQLATIDWLRRQCYVSILTFDELTEKSDILVSPNGLLFAVLTPQKVGTNFHFYSIEDRNKSQTAIPLYQLNNQNMKYVSFSPFSNYLILYNDTKVWFAEILKKDAKNQFKLIREIEHKNEANSAVWTPCGRFVTLSTKSGDLYNFALYDFIGRESCTHDMRNIRTLVIRPFNMAKETVWPQKRKEQIAARVAEKAGEATDRDKKIRRERKNQANLKQVEGFDRLRRYLEQKQNVWEELQPMRLAKLGIKEETKGPTTVVVRQDKVEILEELEDTN